MKIALAIILILILLIMIMNQNVKKLEAEDKKNDKWFADNGFPRRNGKYVASYISGHPKHSSREDDIIMLMRNGELCFFKKFIRNYNATKPLFFSIPVSDIEEIEVLDKTTMERRVTMGRMLTVGLLAFAWQKQKVTHCSYMIVRWKYLEFEYETIFEHTGEYGIQDFNNAKTAIVEYKANMKANV
jgi:hypothetical protein